MMWYRISLELGWTGSVAWWAAFECTLYRIGQLYYISERF